MIIIKKGLVPLFKRCVLSNRKGNKGAVYKRAYLMECGILLLLSLSLLLGLWVRAEGCSACLISMTRFLWRLNFTPLGRLEDDDDDEVLPLSLTSLLLLLVVVLGLGAIRRRRAASRCSRASRSSRTL
jgi:MYXO-CTERM domain-containing protein